MPAVDEIVVKLMVELISALSLVTRKLKKRQLRESFTDLMYYLTQWAQFIKNFFAVAVQQKLERLLREEEQAVGEPALQSTLN